MTKLSDRLKEQTKRIDWGYCFDVEEIQELEDKAANWDMLERLLIDGDVVHVGEDNAKWMCGRFCGTTPAEALRAYWESKK